ncbi:hypothetical protein C8R43DRAFT_987448 [Mycena crocata]|nr:hypothetical protein C8R43DRAFT_987448 [Mycena crocata]
MCGLWCVWGVLAGPAGLGGFAMPREKAAAAKTDTGQTGTHGPTETGTQELPRPQRDQSNPSVSSKTRGGWVGKQKAEGAERRMKQA